MTKVQVFKTILVPPGLLPAETSSMFQAGAQYSLPDHVADKLVDLGVAVLVDTPHIPAKKTTTLDKAQSIVKAPNVYSGITVRGAEVYLEVYGLLKMAGSSITADDTTIDLGCNDFEALSDFLDIIKANIKPYLVADIIMGIYLHQIPIRCVSDAGVPLSLEEWEAGFPTNPKELES